MLKSLNVSDHLIIVNVKSYDRGIVWIVLISRLTFELRNIDSRREQDEVQRLYFLSSLVQGESLPYKRFYKSSNVQWLERPLCSNSVIEVCFNMFNCLWLCLYVVLGLQSCVRFALANIRFPTATNIFVNDMSRVWTAIQSKVLSK